MSQARIYRPTKTAMQSGKAKCQQWRFEYCEPRSLSQVDLFFDSLEEAMAYAQRSGVRVEIVQPNVRHVIRRAYSDNFKYQ